MNPTIIKNYHKGFCYEQMPKCMEEQLTAHILTMIQTNKQVLINKIKTHRHKIMNFPTFLSLPYRTDNEQERNIIESLGMNEYLTETQTPQQEQTTITTQLQKPSKCPQCKSTNINILQNTIIIQNCYECGY